MRRTTKYMTAVAILLSLAARSAHAGNIDLATVPPRATVQLTIYNSEDLTLVRETRSLSLRKGANRIQYSWANTLIDPTSVEIRPLEMEDSIEILDTTFPADRPQQLIWNIESQVEDEVRFQVTYFTSGISWSSSYVLTANEDESALTLQGYVTVTNNSGEDYENAQVRLVVGVVNLVEKIADLARRGVQPPPTPAIAAMSPEAARDRRMRTAAMELALATADMAGARAPAEIIKEGLSEYFIYTIEGTRTIPHGWAQRMPSFTAHDVGFEIVHRLRPEQYGSEPVRFFILTNSAENSLGTTPLPDGVVRVFRKDGRDALSFLGAEQVAYVPINDRIEINVGPDDLVVAEASVASVARSGFVYDRNRRVEGWEETRVVKEEIRNYREKPIRIEVRRVTEGDVEMRAPSAKVHDYKTVEFVFEIPARQAHSYDYSYTRRFGVRERQQRVMLL